MGSPLDDPRIKSLIASANKKYGDETLVPGTLLKNRKIHRTTTGSLALDLALGGGWPLNSWNEIIGQPSSGKTVIAMKTIAAAMEEDPDYVVLWVASEEFVVPWAESCGIDVSRVLLTETKIMEYAYQLIIEALRDRAVDAIVLDSLPHLVPGPEAEKNVEDPSVALAAKLTNKFLRVSGDAGRRSLTEEDRPWLGLIINQFRSKIGVMFGDPRTTPGGEGKNFAYMTRMEASRDEWLVDKETKAKQGISIKAKIIKNKTAPPMRVATTDFYFERVGDLSAGDFDTSKELFTIAVDLGVIEREKNTYYYDGLKLGGSAPAALLTLKSTLDTNEAVEDEVRRILTPNDQLER